MSKENVEKVRRVWEIVAGEGVEVALLHYAEYFTEDSVFEDVPELPDHAVYVGREGMREIDRHFRERWGELIQEPVEFSDGGDDLVLGEVAMRGQGLGSGVPLQASAFWVHEVREGKCARMRAFTTRAQSLEAAGLSE
jgi:ketosteroid isomerase-like protein